MSRFLILIKGELQRLTKYHVTTVSFIVAIIWFLMLYFIDDMDVLAQMLPFIIVIDATMMSVIFIGAIMFFEKTEQTFSTMLVTPATNTELILSKAIANTIHTVISSMMIVTVFHFVKGVDVQWLGIIVALIVSVMFHSLLGFVFSFHSKDFTSMLVGVMTYVFIFTIPSILNTFDILFKGKTWEYILLITPSQAASKLIEIGFSPKIELVHILSFFVLVIGGILGFIYYIKPNFKKYAVKQSGV